MLKYCYLFVGNVYKLTFMVTHYPSEKVTTLHLRKHNEALILSAIYNHATISRAQIARLVNISRPTVTELTQIMLQRDLLTIIGPDQTIAKVGKPGEMLSLNPDAYHLLVVDMSGNSACCTLMDLRLRPIRQQQVTVTYDPAQTIEGLIHVLDRLRETSTRPILGIGISVPGIIDTRLGVIGLASNLGWENVPLAFLIQKQMGIPVHIGNDANLAALGEFWFGKGRRIDNLVVIISGLGIGAGIISNGALVGGFANGLGGIGHIPLGDPTQRCTCGNYGCLETIASGWAITKQARELAQAHSDSALSRLGPDPTPLAVWQAARQGDETASLLMGRVSEYLGRGVATLINLIGPDRLILAGWIAELGEEFLGHIRDSSRKHALVQLSDHAEMFASELGSDISMLGAGALLLEKELSLWKL